MISWDDRDEGYDMPQRYQAELDAAEGLRLRDGWQPLVGWRGEPLEMCPLPGHGYGLVEGLCGVCVKEIDAAAEAAFLKAVEAA